MAFGTSPKDASGIPIGGLYTPDVGLTAFQAGPQTTDGSGNAYAPAVIMPVISTIGTPTSVNGSATAVQLLASNGNRKGACIYNDSGATLYLGLFVHGTLTTSLYTTQVPPNRLYELPTGFLYTGEISGIWATATGAARITEMS